VTSFTDDQLAMFVRQRTLTPEVEQALRGIIAKKGEVAAVARELADRTRETEQIFKDQERLRENLKAMKGSPEERSLVSRYTRQLDEQETRLDVIKREIAEREAKRARLQAELDALVQGLSYGGK
jgi:chromosome segregation ATPase